MQGPGAASRADVLFQEGERLDPLIAPRGRMDACSYHVRPPISRHPPVLGLGAPALPVEAAVVFRRGAMQAHRRDFTCCKPGLA